MQLFFAITTQVAAILEYSDGQGKNTAHVDLSQVEFAPTPARFAHHTVVEGWSAGSHDHAADACQINLDKIMRLFVHDVVVVKEGRCTHLEDGADDMDEEWPPWNVWHQLVDVVLYERRVRS